MSPRRLSLLALLAIGVAPGLARAAIPVGLYPFRVPGLSAAQRSELHTLLEGALVSAARRGILQPRSPLLVPASCGEVPAPACLGAAAREGVVLVGRGEIKGSVLLVSAALYDRNGARTREARFVVDLVIQNLRPIGDAVIELEIEIDPDGTIAGSRKAPPPERDPHGPTPAVAVAPPPLPARPQAAPAPVPVPAASAATPPAATTAPPVAVAPVVPAPPPVAIAPPPLPPRPLPTPAPARKKLQVAAPAAPAPAWKRQAGPLFTIVGGALLAGGATVAVLNKSLAEDLETKRAAGKLSPADRSSFDKVDRYNVLSSLLLGAGGVSAAAGTYLWITAPARPGGGAVAMVGGTF